MHSIIVKLLLCAAVGVWLLVCLWIYRLYRNAAWLAGSSVTSCLFLLGATVAASCFVHGAFFLAPLWLGIALLLLLHLRVAHRAAGKECLAISTEQPGINASVTSPSVREDETYI